MCFFAYMVAWMPVWLLPFDMIGLQAREESGMRCNELSYSWLQFTWMVIYVMNLSSGYLTYDFARSYLDAGGFTIRMRIYQALISVVQWYAVAAVITLSIIFAIAFGTGRYSDGLFWDWTFTVAFALANFYAVGIFIWLLAHALIELPRRVYYLSQLDWAQRHSCFVVGVALQEIGEAELEWERAVQKLDLETKHITAAGPVAPKWEPCFEALREEWRLTEVAVRSLPIAGNRWPPPPPPSFFADDADVLPRRADTAPAATARTATTPKRAYTHGVNSSLTKQGPVDEAGSNGHANGQHTSMREPLWLRNPKVLREGSPGAEVFALPPEAAKAAVRAAKALPTPTTALPTPTTALKTPTTALTTPTTALPTPVPLPPPATTPLPLPPPAMSTGADADAAEGHWANGAASNEDPWANGPRAPPTLAPTHRPAPVDTGDAGDAERESTSRKPMSRTPPTLSLHRQQTLRTSLFGSNLMYEDIDARDRLQLRQMEELNQQLRRVAATWRRANRVFEAALRHMLQLHGTRLPVYQPGEGLTPVVRIVGATGALRRRTAHVATLTARSVYEQATPHARAAVSRFSVSAAAAREAVSHSYAAAAERLASAVSPRAGLLDGHGDGGLDEELLPRSPPPP
ncbi:hypothetical protein Ctob_006809, partial [Chrysochromulina tobinii]